MYELIVILCLSGGLEQCGQVAVQTNSCPGALQAIMAKAPKGAAVRGLTCRRATIQLPPSDPKKERTKT